MNSAGEDKNNAETATVNYDVLDLWTGKVKFQRIGVFAIFGVILPIVCVLYEKVALLCQETLFYPLPTTGHLALVLSVPLTNILLIWCLVTRNVKHPNFILLCGAFVSAVELVYALLFAPYYPISILLIAFFGLGLLALVPLMSLICTFVLMRNYQLLIHKSTDKNRRQAKPLRISGTEISGFILALIMFIVSAVPNSVTYYYLDKATNENAAVSHEGLNGLRKWGNLQLLLKECYDNRGWSPDLLCTFGLKHQRPSTNKIREIVYRVTGQPFNSFPRDTNILQKKLDPLADFEFDPDLGGEAVGGIVRDLSLKTSTVNESIDADGHVAYLEWDMTFANDSPRSHEARMQVLLPQGAVVSRATLWVNGKMREATIAKTAQARKAYQAVVHTSMDPLLVTT